MLASAPDEDGPRAPCGAARARGRRGSSWGLHAALGGLVERPARVDRALRVGARGGGGDGGFARLAAAGAGAGGVGRIGAFGRVWRVVRDLRFVVDRAGAVGAWVVLGGPRVEGAAALLLGGAAGAAVAVWAFSRPGLAKDLQPHAARVHDGAWFAVLFVLAAAAVGALAYLGSLLEERRPLSVERRRLVGRTVLGVLAVGAAAAVVALAVVSKPEGWFREFTAPATDVNQTIGPQRLTTVSSMSRWQWW